MCATYIRCGAERHLGRESMGVLMQATLPACREELLARYAGAVQTVYLDPPFNTGKRFDMKVRIGEKGYRTGSPSITLPAYDDRWPSREAYLSMMRDTLTLARDLMKKEGTIFLHIDCRMHAHMRLLMDEVFGESNFLNEIIWSYQSGGRARTYFPRKHDVILFYAKSRTYYFNLRAVPIARSEARSNHMKRSVDEDGRAYRSIMSAGKEYRYYDDEPVYPGDVWDDVSHLQQKDPQRTGYDTQKPLRLLERVILSSSRPGDLVCDLFSGSGTTLEAAWLNGRRSIGVDMSGHALETTRRRMNGAEIACTAPECAGTPEAEADMEAGIAYYDVRLHRYEIEPGVCARTFSGLDAVDNWAVGYLRGGVYKSEAASFRLRQKPALDTVLQLPVLEGKPCLRIGDVMGRHFYYLLDGENAAGIF